MRHSILVAALMLAAATAAAQEPPANKQEAFTKAVFFGKRFADLKEWQSAYEQFAKADALVPDQAGVLYNMAVLLAKAGRYAESQARVDRYLRLFPAGAERALITRLQLELDFQRELQKKRQADEGYVELFHRGEFLYTRNDLKAALKAFQDAQQQRPDDAAAIFNEAVVLERLGELGTAADRFRRYVDLETDPDLKARGERRVFALERDIEDMKTKIVCPFCGFKLPAGAAWCPHCWHGPYLTASPVWNTRSCAEGASATRATFFADNRFQRNESLSCLFPNGTLAESIRYTPARQRAIQDARRTEGWTYDGDVIGEWSSSDGEQVRYIQAGYLEKVVAPGSGEVLLYTAHAAAPGVWLLDREDIVIAGQKYTIRRTFDAANRIAREEVEYENAAGCDHVIDMSADFVYQQGALTMVKLRGGYEGFPAEGSPRVEWQGTIAYGYDSTARVAREDLAITSWTKTYTQKPFGALRAEVAKVYPAMRTNRPIENLARSGDICATSGATLLGNPIDLRPFYAMSPDLAMVLPPGVTRAVVTFTYSRPAVTRGRVGVEVSPVRLHSGTAGVSSVERARRLTRGPPGAK